MRDPLGPNATPRWQGRRLGADDGHRTADPTSRCRDPLPSPDLRRPPRVAARPGRPARRRGRRPAGQHGRRHGRPRDAHLGRGRERRGRGQGRRACASSGAPPPSRPRRCSRGLAPGRTTDRGRRPGAARPARAAAGRQRRHAARAPCTRVPPSSSRPCAARSACRCCRPVRSAGPRHPRLPLPRRRRPRRSATRSAAAPTRPRPSATAAAPARAAARAAPTCSC